GVRELLAAHGIRAAPILDEDDERLAVRGGGEAPAVRESLGLRAVRAEGVVDAELDELHRLVAEGEGPEGLIAARAVAWAVRVFARARRCPRHLAATRRQPAIGRASAPGRSGIPEPDRPDDREDLALVLRASGNALQRQRQDHD